MKKEDLKTGMVVKLRNGTVYEVLRDTANEYYGHILRGKGNWVNLDKYNDDLTDSDYGLSSFDIVEVHKSGLCTSNINTFPDIYELIWKREQEKFYLKHNWLEGYLNYNIVDKNYELGDKEEWEDYKTQFTLEDIEKIERELDITLHDFTFEPVGDY
ncbi:MAG TPA: hypothetical protein VFC79_11175 [Tissierellaceae bacterium]|nr:hypothetical protein [Tissierellaceae bacterium]